VVVPEHIILANVDQPVISPDGRLVAFAAARDGRRQLWVRPLTSSSPAPLAGTDDARSPVWSPDSGGLAFLTGSKLKKVDARGGLAVTICDAPAIGAAWGRSGVIVFSADRLKRVADSGGVPVNVTTLDAARNKTPHFVAGFLADGRRFVFSDGAQPPTFHVADAESAGASRLLGSGPLADLVGGVTVVDGHLLYVQQGRLMAQRFDEKTLELQGASVKLADGAWRRFSASESGTIVFRSGGIRTRQLTWIGRDGARRETLGPPDVYTHVELSPGGTRAVLVRSAPHTTELTDLLMVDLTTGIVSTLTDHAGLEADPAWSPDERSIAYSSTQSDTVRPFRKDLVSGREKQLVESTDALVVDDWTEDGRVLIVREVAGRRVFALSVAERSLRLIADISQADQSQISPDGHWIAFNSRASDAWDVHVATFPGFTERRQVSSGGGVQPRWRRDGRELFYLAPDGTIMSVEVAPEGEPSFRAPRRVFKTSLTSALPSMAQYDVSADGKRFLILDLTPSRHRF
jgi:Tol biopolymer transport system component